MCIRNRLKVQYDQVCVDCAVKSKANQWLIQRDARGKPVAQKFLNVFNILRVFLCIITLLHTHTQPFYGSVEFVRDNSGEPVPEETFTHYYIVIYSLFYITCMYVGASVGK